MTTWLEDNWFNRLDRLFEKEKLLDYPLRNPDAKGDGNNYKMLDVDNLADFPELMELFFVEADMGDFYDFNEHPENRLGRLVRSIYYRDDEKGECRQRAEIFKSCLIDTFIDFYKSKTLDPVEQRWQKEAKAEDREDPVKKNSFFKTKLGKTVEEIYQELDNVRRRAEECELRKIPKDAQSVNHDTRAILFDVRPDFIAINTTSNIIRDEFGKYRKRKDFVTTLKHNYTCSSFRTGIVAVEGGKANWEIAEDSYITVRNLEQFQNNVYSLVKDHFRVLPEAIYRQFQKRLKAYVSVPPSKNAPAMEALKVARITEQWFKNRIGCIFEERDGRVVIRTMQDDVRSIADTQELWDPLYRADAVYLIDSDGDLYSDGTPAKLYISVQVKSGESNFGGSGEAWGKVLKALQGYGKKMNSEDRKTFKNPALEARPTQVEINVVTKVFRNLCRGGYIVARYNSKTKDSWENWFWLPDDYEHEPLRKGDYDDSKGENYYTRFIYAGHHWKLRIPKPGKSGGPMNDIKLEPDYIKDR